jgi:hypothetical protein
MSNHKLEKNIAMVKSKEKNCYISAPFGFDALPIIEALAERNFGATRLDDLTAGESIVTGVQREIRQADFVCVVLPGGYRQDNVIFEAGLALGRGRRVLVLAESEVDIPFELAQLTYVRTSLSDKKAVGEVLDAYLPGLLSRKPSPRKQSDQTIKRLSKEAAEEALRALHDPQAISGRRLEGIVSKVFQDVGILTSQPPPPNSHRGPDLAIWIDETESIFGNPIFVEVKAGRITQSQIDDAYHQLSYHLIRAKMLLGIIVYWNLEGAKFKVAVANLPLVVCLSIEELIDTLRLGTLAKTLIGIRNRAVHGVVA